MALGCHLKRLFWLGKVWCTDWANDTKFLCGVGLFWIFCLQTWWDETKNPIRFMNVCVMANDGVCGNQSNATVGELNILYIHNNRFRSCHGIYSNTRMHAIIRSPPKAPKRIEMRKRSSSHFSLHMTIYKMSFKFCTPHENAK